MHRSSTAAGTRPARRAVPWTIEELRAHAERLLLPGAASKSRFELIELLGGADRLGDPARYRS